MFFSWIHKCIVLILAMVFILFVYMYISNYLYICFNILACTYVKTDLHVHMLNNLVTKLYKLFICSTYMLLPVYICISVFEYFQSLFFFRDSDINLVFVFFVCIYILISFHFPVHMFHFFLVVNMLKPTSMYIC